MKELKKQEIDRLVDWYRLNKRILPFRDTDDPYDVWISEIMLQQTRIEAAVSYFLRFKKEILDIDTLAGVDEDRLLRLWEMRSDHERRTSGKDPRGA